MKISPEVCLWLIWFGLILLLIHAVIDSGVATKSVDTALAALVFLSPLTMFLYIWPLEYAEYHRHEAAKASEHLHWLLQRPFMEKQMQRECNDSEAMLRNWRQVNAQILGEYFADAKRSHSAC